LLKDWVLALAEPPLPIPLSCGSGGWRSQNATGLLKDWVLTLAEPPLPVPLSCGSGGWCSQNAPPSPLGLQW